MITADERAAMRASVDGAIAAATENGSSVDAALAELGWREMLAEPGVDAIGIVFAALGRANATATALDDVLSVTCGFEPSADLAVLLPRFATWDAPGQIDGNEVVAQGIATDRAATAAEIAVICNSGATPTLAIVSMTAVELTEVVGVDPDAGLRSVRIRGRANGATPLDADAWSSIMALGRRCIAHQIEGTCRTMLDLARTHALERTQFGRPIARFQAVRHRLAEALVAVESLEAALGAARDDPNAETAALAKAIAGRAAHTTARHCQQVLAGIGFTTEHRFHRYLKRALALEGLFGSADAITLDIGRRLLAERRVPTLIEL